MLAGLTANRIAILNMKSTILLSAATLLVAACTADATVIYDQNFTSGFFDGGVIPDGNPGGWVDSRTVSGLGDSPIDNVSVRLDISGGYNGDLYGYLVYQSVGGDTSAMAVLLNRVGTGAGDAITQLFGYANPGMNVTLDDSSVSTSIHNYGGTGVPSGTYNSDGGNLGATFNGQSANGTWTLFFADLSNGGGASKVTSWGLTLDVAPVPEPVTTAGMIFGALVLTGGLVRRLRAAKRQLTLCPVKAGRREVTLRKRRLEIPI